MAGILNPKDRVLDTIITPVGRAQISTGELKIEYASFSDRQAYYTTSSNGELDDPGQRLNFEAYSTDADLIIPEIDADANLVPFQTDTFTLYGGNVISGSQEQGNVRIFANALPMDSIQSLSRQMILGTRNQLKNEHSDNFFITPEDATFYVENVIEASSGSGEVLVASLNDIEALWQDYRITNTPNYQYLPPQNLPKPGEVTGSVLGSYTKINQDPPTSYEEILSNVSDKQVQKFTFSNTRTSNDIIGQIFEISENKLSKLILVDGGTFSVDSTTDPHVFYAGKLYRDSRGMLTFVNIFTLVFE